MRKVRKLRHWKQRFDEKAQFIWRKAITWQGKVVELGEPIPEELAASRTKLRRFWESGVIELAEFEEPDVQTGQAPATPKDMKPADTLLGSDVLDSTLEINGEEISLGEVVTLAFEASGMTLEEWNAQDDADREAKLQEVVEGMEDLGPEIAEEPEEPTEAKDPEQAAEKPSEADTKPVEPETLVTKETDRKWHVKGLEEVFKSKTLAVEAATKLLASDEDFLK